MRCPDCNAFVSVLTLRLHQAKHDPAVASEIAEDVRRYRAAKLQLDEDAKEGRNARIQRQIASDNAKWLRQHRADQTRAVILARAKELRATPGPRGKRFDPSVYMDANGALLDELEKEFSKGPHKRSRETIRGYLAKSNKQK